jgi:hypothetical protein
VLIDAMQSPQTFLIEVVKHDSKILSVTDRKNQKLKKPLGNNIKTVD